MVLVPKAAGHPTGPVSCGTPFGPPVTSESVEPVSPAMMEAETDEIWHPNSPTKTDRKAEIWLIPLEGMLVYDIICVPSMTHVIYD